MYNVRKFNGILKGVIGEHLFNLSKKWVFLTFNINRFDFIELFKNSLNEDQKQFLVRNWRSIDAVEIIENEEDEDKFEKYYKKIIEKSKKENKSKRKYKKYYNDINISEEYYTKEDDNNKNQEKNDEEDKYPKLILYEVKTRNYYRNFFKKPKMSLNAEKVYKEGMKLGFKVKLIQVILFDDWRFNIKEYPFDRKYYSLEKKIKFQKKQFLNYKE